MIWCTRWQILQGGENNVCLVCIEYSKGKMTAEEALRALGEMSPDLEEEHAERVYKNLLEEWWQEWHENMPQTD